MTAYLLALIQLRDPARYAADYAAHMQDTLDPFGGQFLAEPTPLIVREGDFGNADQAVLIAFPDLPAAEAWYLSDAYAPLIEVRKATAQARLAFIAPDGSA